MQDRSFNAHYLDIMNHFGVQSFPESRAIELWEHVHDLPEKEGVDVFSWAKNKFTKKNPPKIEDLIKKAQAIKLIEQQRQENLKEPGPDRLSSSGLAKFLESTGYSSLKELTRNKFKPKT